LIMAEKRENVVHVKLSDDADKALELLVLVHADSAAKSTIAASLLERALLGEAHTVRMALARLARHGFTGRAGE
jgi:hypothetical protein